MKLMLKSVGLELGVVALCAWQSASLLTAWRHSPFDRMCWLSFLIWLLPVAVYLASPSRIKNTSMANTVLALSFVISGKIFDFNILMHIAMALSLSTFLPTKKCRVIWLVAALAWMPLLGWLARDLPMNAVAGLRLFIASAAAVLLIYQPIPKAQLE
jgi:hypothetical protein